MKLRKSPVNIIWQVYEFRPPLFAKPLDHKKTTFNCITFSSCWSVWWKKVVFLSLSLSHTHTTRDRCFHMISSLFKSLSILSFGPWAWPYYPAQFYYFLKLIFLLRFANSTCTFPKVDLSHLSKPLEQDCKLRLTLSIAEVPFLQCHSLLTMWSQPSSRVHFASKRNFFLLSSKLSRGDTSNSNWAMIRRDR